MWISLSQISHIQLVFKHEKMRRVESDSSYFVAVSVPSDMFVYQKYTVINCNPSCRELNETSDGKISNALQEASFFSSPVLYNLIIILISCLDE